MVINLHKLSAILALVLLVMVAAPVSAVDLPAVNFANGYLRGKVEVNGKAPVGALVFAFNELSGPSPSTELYWRAPDMVGEPEGSGSFQMELPAGVYYVVVMSRAQGQDIGPPQQGDVFYYNPDKTGIPLRYEVIPLKTTDIGAITGKFPFKKENVQYDKGVTSVEGTITGSEGKPVAGALVFAYTNPSMFGRPMYVSERSGKDGMYVLRVRDGGTYYLKVRSVYGGGRPAAGEAMGEFRDRGPESVILKTGEKIKGVDFKVNPFKGRTNQPAK